MSRAKESAQYAKYMQSKVTLQKSIDIEKVGVTNNVQYNRSSPNGANITAHASHKRATFQWSSSKSALEEGEAPFPARRARVSRVLLSWFIFEPAPREINVSEIP